MTEKATQLKVIGAGFGRTGTLSLKVALEALGFGPCYHMTEVFEHPEDLHYWEAATRGEAVNWQELMSDYQAAVDWPSCAFYEQLMQVYPDAKVLLSVRNPERWYESVCSTIYRVAALSTMPLARLIALLNPTIRARIRVGRMITKLVWQGTFHGQFEEKDAVIRIFNQHIEEVKQRVPAEKLLVFDVKEGWGPLCAFLGVEVPQDMPFPHLNDRANFMGNRVGRQMQMQAVALPLLACIVVVVLTTLFLLARRRRQMVVCK